MPNITLQRKAQVLSHAKNDDWLVQCGKSLAPRARVIFFPWAGAGIKPLKDIFEAFDNSIEVLGVHLPGREKKYRSTIPLELDIILDAIASELSTKNSLPLIIAGHSLGGRLAVELAAFLESVCRQQVQNVLVSGCRAPGVSSSVSYRRSSGTVSDDELIKDIQAVGGTNEKIFNDPGIRKIVLSIVRRDYLLLDSLKAKTCPTVTCPIDIFGAERDTTTCEASLQAWGAYSLTESSLTMFDGDHFYLGTDPDTFLRALNDLVFKKR